MHRVDGLRPFKGGLAGVAGMEPILVRPGVADAPCQLQAFPSELERGPPSREEPWRWYVRRRFRGALRKLARLARRLAGLEPAALPRPTSPGARGACALASGDLVRVRPAEAIRRTLDWSGRTHGCAFAGGMFQYCGGEYRVLRVVNRFFDERRWRMLSAHELVLLEGIHCDGKSMPDTMDCDRMCFYFWRTEWLEKVASASPSPGASSGGRPPS
jgi:hypothetical protein